MTPHDYAQLETLLVKFMQLPEDLSMEEVQRLDEILETLASDPDTSEARRIMAALQRVFVRQILKAKCEQMARQET